MKKLFLIFSLFVIHTVLYSQTNTPKYNIPDNYNFILPEDYTPYEPQILEAIDWYLWRSLAFDSDKREKAGTFFLKWLTGTPTVNVEIDNDIINFGSNNPQLILPFAMGWAKYSIENKESSNRVKGCTAGITAVVNYYNANKGFLNKDKEIEKYEKLINKNKLENYIKKNMSSSEK